MNILPKPRKSNRYRKFITLDMETDPFFDGRSVYPFLACIYSGTEYRLYAKYEEMPPEIKKYSKSENIYNYCSLVPYLKKQKAICYAHNGGKFDFHFLRDHIPHGTEILLVNGRILQFQLGHCEFRDSYSLIGARLSEWDKQKIDYRFFEKEDRYAHDNFPQIVSYIKSDCKHLFDMITKFRDEYGTGLTQASVSYQKLRKKYPGIRVMRQRDNERLRTFFHGGRTQFFRLGEIRGDYKLIDINSAYPYVMHKFKHPYAPDYEWSLKGSFGIENISHLPKRTDFIGPNMYLVECISGGAFPYRQNKNGETPGMVRNELIYPCDDKPRIYHVTGWELAAALDLKLIRDVTIISLFKFNNVTNFANYIGPLWEARKRAKTLGDHQEALFTKLMMNSVYGKFASNPAYYERTYVVASEEFGGNISKTRQAELARYKKEGFEMGTNEFGLGTCLMRRRLTNEEAVRSYQNVATSASISGCVRAMMLRAMFGATSLLYVDTDSILAEDFSNIDYGDELGQWSQEGEFDLCRIVAKKAYALHIKGTPETFHMKHWKLASKGVDLHPRDYVKLCKKLSVVKRKEAPVFSVHSAERQYALDRTIIMSDKTVGKIEQKTTDDLWGAKCHVPQDVKKYDALDVVGFGYKNIALKTGPYLVGLKY